MDQHTRVLINLPPSHVGCVTENLMSTIYIGGSAVLLRIFDVKNTLEAIPVHQVNTLGMIPTQFRLCWNHAEYDEYDYSSLEFVIYGGSSVDVAFLQRLSEMAPKFGTGIGMTESGGFVTFTPPGITIEEMAGQVGRFFPDLGPVSIREPMNEDGTAGAELHDGEIGEICYHPPIVFMGYYNQPEATARAISKEGILYTGDLGYLKPMESAEIGPYRALYLSGRIKFVIKQSGFQVFPDEVETFIAELPAVDLVDVIGVKHEILDEGIFAFVRPKEGMDLTAEEVMVHCNGIASYKRPQHVEIWPAGEPFPLTRSAKVDKIAMGNSAKKIVENLKAEGKWDREELQSI